MQAIPTLSGKPPTEKQKEFFCANARYIGYGGARGGGKSWAMRRKMVLLALGYPNLRILLLRRTFPQLNENHIRVLEEELVPQGIATYNKDERVFKFTNGSIIKMGYCDRDEDAYQYQGQEYEVIGFEEATQFTQFQMQYILTCNRTVRTDFSPRAYFTCNPGGVGHDYIKRIFIDKEYDADKGERAEDYVFIQALVDDNPYLMEADPSYIRMLESLPEDLRRAYREGDWGVIEGQYFKEYRFNIHTIEAFDPPAHWKRFRSMDWGYNDPCCVLWYAVGDDGHVYVYKELYVREHRPSEIADTVRSMSEGEKIGYTVASPDIWARRGMIDIVGGTTIAEVMLKRRFSIIKADSARVIGWQRVRENLAIAPDGRPYLLIMRNCRNLIRTLPLMTVDKHDHEDVADGLEDHAMESLRYGLMSRPPIPKPVLPTVDQKRTLRDRMADPFEDNVRTTRGGQDFLPL